METRKKEMINKIRISADLCRNDNPTNYGTGGMVKVKSGDDIVFEFMLLNGGGIVDTSQIRLLNLEIMDIGCINAPEPRSVKLLASKTLEYDEIAEINSVAEFESGKCNASFMFSSQETLWGNGHKWLVLSGYSTDGSKTTFTQGWFETFAMYSSENQTLPEVELQYVRKDYADAFYLNCEANLGDVEDVAKARENLNVYSTEETADWVRYEIEQVSSELNETVGNLTERLENEIETKSNIGEFYFNGGGFKSPKAWTTNGAFSVAFTMCVDVANIPASPTEWIGTTTNIAAGRGMLLSYDKSYIRIYLIWTDSAGNRQMLSKPVRNSSFYDGKPHKWFYIFTGSKVILNIDNTYKLEYDIEDCSEIQHTSGLNFFHETIQIVSRVKAFNFDMSANDAPYTIEDYMAGKEETPLIDTILSLDNAISGTQVFDKSGNKNHANISGEVLCCKVNNLACCSDVGAFSWADTATTQKFGNSDFAIPANSKVVAYAKSSIDVSVKFKCGAHPQEEVALSANTLTEIGTFLNASQGAFTITPTSKITGKIEVYLTMERF